MAQGFALSGEYSGAIIYVSENAPADKRGYYTGFIQATVPVGLVLSLLVVIGTPINMMIMPTVVANLNGKEQAVFKKKLEIIEVPAQYVEEQIKFLDMETITELGLFPKHTDGIHEED